MKLSNLKKKGRYLNRVTKKVVNIHTGRQVGRSVDVLFYYYRHKRKYISDWEFHHQWVLEDEAHLCDNYRRIDSSWVRCKNTAEFIFETDSKLKVMCGGCKEEVISNVIKLLNIKEL